LIDIHSQHQTQELSEELFQFQIIDSVAGNQENINQYSAILSSYKKDKSQLLNLNSKLQTLSKEQDYTSFLLDELLSAKLKVNEQEELEQVYEQLNNVEFIKDNINKSLALANEEQYGILQNLKEIKIALQKIIPFSPVYQSLFERINSLTIEFDDIINELSQQSEILIHDPENLELVNQKLQIIYNLQKKHQVNSVEELLEIQNDLDNKVVSLVELENEINKIADRIKVATSELDNLALIIRNNRLKAVPVLAEKLIIILEQLGMPNVRFNMVLKETDNYFANGKDELQFLFSANKGSDFGLLKKVASGGELSRIMLAVKSILAQYSSLPTIIFDEIDTGVSGEIANKMATIMKDMSSKMQVFSITHLPQIAAKGDIHYKVYKSIKSDTTISELKLLTFEDRIVEIAEMLSGKDISVSAINHAKALLN
jgi:DNA repair protein RecN (Recombination protein N)